jgi:hypothetical protein
MPFRSGSQNDSLLERLKEGPITNSEMIRKMCIFKYTSRISDLRKAGHNVVCTDLGDGLNSYELIR